MILYNITALVDTDIKSEFQEWIHRVFLLDLTNSEHFKTQSLLKVLDSPNEGETFAIQVIARGADEIEVLKSSYLPVLHQQIQQVWNNKVFLFESKMEYIAMF
jgi:hypothetical protein